jgi:hypothetical protein
MFASPPARWHFSWSSDGSAFECSRVVAHPVDEQVRSARHERDRALQPLLEQRRVECVVLARAEPFDREPCGPLRPRGR